MVHKLDVRTHRKFDLTTRYGADAMLKGTAVVDSLDVPKVELFSFGQGQGARCGVLTLALQASPFRKTLEGGAVRDVNRFRCKSIGSRGVAVFLCAGCNGIYVKVDPAAAPEPHCPWCDAQISAVFCDMGHTWGSCRVCEAGPAPFRPSRVKL